MEVVGDGGDSNNSFNGDGQDDCDGADENSSRISQEKEDVPGQSGTHINSKQQHHAHDIRTMAACCLHQHLLTDKRQVTSRHEKLGIVGTCWGTTLFLNRHILNTKRPTLQP